MSTGTQPDRAEDVACLGNGWIRLTPDLMRAVCYEGGARLTVWWAVVERTWGRAWWTKPPGVEVPDAEPCLLNISQLSRETGRNQSDLCSAKNRAVKEGLLIETSDGGLLPNKRFPDWACLRDRPAALEYCRRGADAMAVSRTAERADRFDRGGRPKNPIADPYTPTENPIENSYRVLEISNSLPGKVLEISNNSGPVYRKDYSLDGGEEISAPPPPVRVQTEEEEEAMLDAGLPRLEPLPGSKRALAALQGPPSRSEQALLSSQYVGGSYEPDPVLMDLIDRALVTHFGARDDARMQVERHKRAYPTALMWRLMKRFFAEGKQDVGWALIRKVIRDWAVSPPTSGPEDHYTDDVPIRIIPFSQRAVGEADRGRVAPSDPRSSVPPTAASREAVEASLRLREESRASRNGGGPRPGSPVARMFEGLARPRTSTPNQTPNPEARP
jgi:hypothetical protein